MPMPIARPGSAPDRLSEDLIEASKRGWLSQAQKLIEQGADPRLHESQALSRAARAGHADCVRLLIPVSDPRAQNSSALVQAAYHGHADCVRLLIPRCDIRADNSAPLRHAATAGFADCVELLLQAGGPPPPGDDGRALANMALAMGHPHVASMIGAFYEAHALSCDTPSAQRPPRPRAL